MWNFAFLSLDFLAFLDLIGRCWVFLWCLFQGWEGLLHMTSICVYRNTLKGLSYSDKVVVKIYF